MNELIYGKNDLQNVISLEIINDKAEIFIQKDNGDIEVQFLPNSYWILSNNKHGEGWIRLKGDLHYKWGKKYNNAKQFYADKRNLRNRNADIFVMADDKEAFMVKNGVTYYKGLTPDSISVLSFDIESTGLEQNDNSKILLISNTFRKNGVTIKKLFAYDEYKSQGALLND